MMHVLLEKNKANKIFLLSTVLKAGFRQIVPFDVKTAKKDVANAQTSSLNPFVGTGRQRPLQGNEGRSSTTGRIVTVFGSSGFLGRYVANYLAREGNTVILPFNGEEEDIRHLRLTGDLGQILPLRFDLESPNEILDCVKDSHVVVNCVSREHDTLRFNMEQVNVEGAARIAKACTLTQVPKFIHVSDLRARSDANNRYLITRHQGEGAVLEAYPNAAIVKTGNLYGYEDKFCFSLGVLAIRGFGFPVLKGKINTDLYPLYVGDAAYGIQQIIKNEELYPSPQTYQFFGSELYNFEKLCEVFGNVILRPFKILELPLWAYRAFGLSALLWRKPMYKNDQILTLHTAEGPLKANGGFEHILSLEDIPGMRPLSSFEGDAIKFLRQFRNPEDFELPIMQKRQLARYSS